MRFYILTIFLLITIPLFSQELNPFEQNGLWGYEDENGKIIIQHQWVSAKSFQGEFAIVQIQKGKSKYILIDKNGNQGFNEIFDWIENHSDDRFRFKKDNQYGIIEKDGSKKFPVPWKDFLDKDDRYFGAHNTTGVFRVNETYGLFDNNFQPIIPLEYEKLVAISSTKFVMAKKNRKWGLLSYENDKIEIILNFNFDELDYQYNWKGFNAVKNGKLGIIDFDGNIMIPFEYDPFPKSIYPKKYDWWSDDYFPLSGNDILMFKNGKFGIIDNQNNMIIPFGFDDIEGLNKRKGIYKAKQGGKWGIINLKSNWITPPEFDKISFPTYQNGYHGLIAGDTPPPRSQKVFLGHKENKYSILNFKGSELLPLGNYEDVRVLHFPRDTVVRVMKNKNYGLVSLEGKILLEIEYQSIHAFDRDWHSNKIFGVVFLVQKNGLWGIVDKNGITLQPIEFKKIYSIREVIHQDGRKGYFSIDLMRFIAK